MRRYKFFVGVIAAVCLVISVRLVNLQIVKGSYYREKSNMRTTRVVELSAPRGEILDRYGRSIVKNRTGYSVYIQGNHNRSSESLNRIIANLFCAMPQTRKNILEAFPIKVAGSKYKFSNGKTKSEKWKTSNSFEKSASADEIVRHWCDRFSIDQSEYDAVNVLSIAAVRFDMSNRGFSFGNTYLFCDDASIEEISFIKEQNSKFPDVCVIMQPVRDYPYESLAAHILGRVGGISGDEYEKYKDKDYNINSRIGKDGIEKYMEDYLRGEKGYVNVEQSSAGSSVGQLIEKNPVNGRDISLTIDLDIQKACEDALESTIKEINGDADAGSAVVVDVNTGEILAMASYPSYNPKNYNKDYGVLLENKSKPLFNRSLAGTYSPASTFKILVGTAGLEEGVIDTEETIFDTGRYTYFSDYKPACWIYNQTGTTHGYENVSEAIRDSCNIFFYETGRRLTIDKIKNYAEKFGFGKKSGIELEAEEACGMIACPENREKNGGIWYPGDTCQTAIGQSDTLVTPIQLANYIAAVANGGTRYRPHLIKSVKNADGKNESQTEPEIVEKINIKDKNYDAIVKGIRMVVTEGTAQNAFSGCKTKVAAKTGSAQTATVYTNGVCVAYAPYDKPQVAIACIIEKAGSGAKTADAVRKIVDGCFDDESEDDEPEVNTLTR